MDLVGMQVADNRLNLKMTPLRREGGTWHQSEVRNLTRGLMTEVSGHPKHPEYLILYGHHAREKLDNVLGDVEPYSATQIIGTNSPELPFVPAFA